MHVLVKRREGSDIISEHRGEFLWRRLARDHHQEDNIDSYSFLQEFQEHEYGHTLHILFINFRAWDSLTTTSEALVLPRSSCKSTDLKQRHEMDARVHLHFFLVSWLRSWFRTFMHIQAQECLKAWQSSKLSREELHRPRGCIWCTWERRDSPRSRPPRRSCKYASQGFSSISDGTTKPA
ncbi:hypothetical protein VNO77_08214 [Canavalia gladiata]|uniref:Uncharacterized protein n=1 Tax=Canavalia gladiata TaxID=3824 RepID=A0AAN9M8E4_CANGL